MDAPGAGTVAMWGHQAHNKISFISFMLRTLQVEHACLMIERGMPAQKIYGKIKGLLSFLCKQNPFIQHGPMTDTTWFCH